MEILILISPHSSSAGSNLKSPEALNLTLFAAAVHSLFSLTCYPRTSARDWLLQDLLCMTVYRNNPSNSFRERKIWKFALVELAYLQHLDEYVNV